MSKRIRITKEFGFEMAHALKGHDGPCRFIHGHSYGLSVTITGIPEEDTSSHKLGMVLDFSVLKKIVKENIIDIFDHALVLNRTSLLEEKDTSPELFEKLLLVDYQPTSENLLLDFVGRIQPHLHPGVCLYSMKIRETATSYAEWFAEDKE
ncbi:MAG: 6-carboxytetrahydropterin synthase [Bacteroidetes bacterium]|nr:6-carboxytetrahydropterin synthase [Bacteroidota bacterium]